MTDENIQVDGGQNALRGFVVQALGALLNALEDDQIASVEIEPYSDDGSCQKVDCRFQTEEGHIRAIQIKHSQNAICKPDAQRWAEELRTSANATEYELHIFAPTTGPLAALDQHIGVCIRHLYGEVPVLWDAACFRAHKQLVARRGNYDPVAVSDACRGFVGETIVRALEQKCWTRIELLNALIAHVETQQVRLKSEPEPLDVTFRRIVIGHDDGSCDEHVKYIFRNKSDRPIAPFQWMVTWTESDNVEVLGVSDGL